MSADYFTSAERMALDRFTVPAMRAGLATAIVTSVNAGASTGASLPPRRGTRGGWRRHGGMLLGAGALLVASATAAATGWLGKLPIAIPGITRAVEEPVAKPRPIVHAPKPRPAAGKPVQLAAAPVAEASPDAVPTPLPGEQWRARRAARIAAGLPVRRPLMQRIMADRLAALPPDQRAAAIQEWRRIKALPPAERKAAIARVRNDYLAQHPRMAARYQQRLEARSAAAADDRKPGAAPLPDAMPQARPPLTAEQRAERRARWQAWRAQRAQRLQNGQ